MRRIGRIEVENFKSLVDFEIDLPRFSCLIGLNGAGKSTVLQFIDFLSQLVRGDIKGWLNERKWKPADLKSKLTKKANIEFCVHFCHANGEPAGRWEAIYSPSQNHCTKERIDLLDSVLDTRSGEVEALSLKRPPPNEWTDWKVPITFSYEGSILSVLREKLLPPSIAECKKMFSEVTSLDLLAPEHLRQRNRESSGTLGRGGQNLSAFLHEMSDQKRQRLVAKLKEVYRRLQGLHARSLRSGWKQLEIIEEYISGSLSTMKTEARHINDGMLRLIAVLAELQSDNQFLLFDEIENGINPELVEFLLDSLVSAPQQVMVTTHSPLILNYLDDKLARAGVIYLYKSEQGHTQAIPFFSIPSLAEKLKFMGPGEAFADTNLTALADEIAQVTAGR
jgi:ABC-type branched-subunit amino acid transport system ATPase component